jgi:hypothetical protein
MLDKAPLGGSSPRPDFQPLFEGESRFAYLPEWWVQGLANGNERRLCPAFNAAGQGIKFTDDLALLWVFLFSSGEKRRLRQWQDEVQDAKFRPSRSFSCPRKSKVANSASTLDQRGGGEFMRCGSKSLSDSACHLLFQDFLTRELGPVLVMFHARDLLLP